MNPGIVMATDHYRVLGVSRDASVEQIRSAFRKLAKQLHPDVAAAAADSTAAVSARFQEVVHAYRTLSNPDARLFYDKHYAAHEMLNSLRSSVRGCKNPKCPKLSGLFGQLHADEDLAGNMEEQQNAPDRQSFPGSEAGVFSMIKRAWSRIRDALIDAGQWASVALRA